MSKDDRNDRSKDVLVSLRRMMGPDAAPAQDNDRKAAPNGKRDRSGGDGPREAPKADSAEAGDAPLTLTDPIDDDVPGGDPLAAAVAPETVALPDAEPLPLDAPVDEDGPLSLDEPSVDGEPVKLDELFDEEAATAAADDSAGSLDFADEVAGDLPDDAGATPPAGDRPEGEVDSAAARKSENKPLTPPDWDDGASAAAAATTLPARLGDRDPGAGDALPVDKAGLEELIRKIIRDELVDGEVGRNISRNVLRLVRQEIDRTLTRRGL